MSLKLFVDVYTYTRKEEPLAKSHKYRPIYSQRVVLEDGLELPSMVEFGLAPTIEEELDYYIKRTEKLEHQIETDERLHKKDEEIRRLREENWKLTWRCWNNNISTAFL